MERWVAAEGRPPAGVMVGPVPVTPLRRTVIVDAGDHYETGTLTWRPRGVRFDQAPVPRNDALPAVVAARGAPNVQAFLVWSRFPYWQTESRPDGTLVTVSDMRFAGQLP